MPRNLSECAKGGMSKFNMSNVLGNKIFFSLSFSKRLCSFNGFKALLGRRFYRRATNFNRPNSSRLGWLAVAGGFGTGAVYWLTAQQSSLLPNSFVLSAASNDEEVAEVKADMTLKQMKFEEYASYEYGGKRLMSPQDFLNSLVDNKEGTCFTVNSISYSYFPPT